jgi:hypothetical protein
VVLISNLVNIVANFTKFVLIVLALPILEVINSVFGV